MVVLAFSRVDTSGRRSSDAPQPGRLPAHEAVALIGLVLLPFVAIALAKYVTNAFTYRYVLPAGIGVIILAGIAGHRLLVHSSVLMLGVLVVLLGWFGYGCWLSHLHRAQRNQADLRQIITFLEDTIPGDARIAVAEATPYHRIAYYAPPRLARRLVYLADPQLSLRYLEHDTVDRGLLALRPWFPRTIAPYADFITRHPRFFVFGYVYEGWMWLTYQLPLDGLDATLIARQKNRLLLEVRGTLRTHHPPIR